MQVLLDAVLDFVSLVSPGKVHAVARALRGLNSPDDIPVAGALVDTPAARAALARVKTAWTQVQVNGDEIAGLLLGASEMRQRGDRELSVELVWTGPTTRFVPTRRTDQVLLDLISGARHELFLVSFVAYDVTSVTRALRDAVSRGVLLRILLEASAVHGGSLTIDPVATLRTCVPGAEIYSWAEKAAPFVGGRVHAKVAVADASRAFLTSANLTGHALEKNMEAGVLVQGGSVPRSLSEHLVALIEMRIIVRA